MVDCSRQSVVMDMSLEMKVSLDQLCMDNSTIHLFKTQIEEDLDLTWEKFKDALLKRYGGFDEGNMFEQLTRFVREEVWKSTFMSLRGWWLESGGSQRHNIWVISFMAFVIVLGDKFRA